MTLSEPPPRAAVRAHGRDARRRRSSPPHDEWEAAGLLALVGIGVEPGLSDVFARYAPDHLFSDDRRGRRARRRGPRGRGLRVRAHVLDLDDDRGVPEPAADLGARARLLHDRRRSREPEMFEFPEGIGPVECVNVEHEEVVLIPRWRRLQPRDVQVRPRRGVHRRAAHAAPLGLDSTEPIDVRGAQVAPRDVVAAALPDPATLGDRMTGRTCAGTLVTGTGKDGAAARDLPVPRGRQRDDDARATAAQAVVWQTAVNPVAALELLAERRLVRRRRARARRPSTRCRSSTSSPSSARRTASSERDPADPQVPRELACLAAAARALFADEARGDGQQQVDDPEHDEERRRRAVVGEAEHERGGDQAARRARSRAPRAPGPGST